MLLSAMWLWHLRAFVCLYHLLKPVLWSWKARCLEDEVTWHVSKAMLNHRFHMRPRLRSIWRFGIGSLVPACRTMRGFAGWAMPRNLLVLTISECICRLVRTCFPAPVKLTQKNWGYRDMQSISCSVQGNASVLWHTICIFALGEEKKPTKRTSCKKHVLRVYLHFDQEFPAS